MTLSQERYEKIKKATWGKDTTPKYVLLKIGYSSFLLNNSDVNIVKLFEGAIEVDIPYGEGLKLRDKSEVKEVSVSPVADQEYQAMIMRKLLGCTYEEAREAISKGELNELDD